MYKCIITGKSFDLSENNKGRELGTINGSNIRQRALIYALTKCLFNKVTLLNEFPQMKNIKGIGMSDSGSIVDKLSHLFDYKNTYYHTEPFLDIYCDDHVAKYNDLDFIISSDVFEHISPHPNIQFAFNNLYKMLKYGGHLVFSVPFTYEKHYEHFPLLYNYTIEKINDNKYSLENTTINGKKEIYTNCYKPDGTIGELCFHGGPGTTLEMRIFSQQSLINYLNLAGFKDITFYSPNSIKDMQQYGIFWENECSLVLSCRK